MTSTLDHQEGAAPVRRDPIAARLAFDAAVDQLTQPGMAVIERDGGRVERGLTPCLLDQLVQATAPGGERSGSSNPGSRPPASMNALAVVAEIGSEMRRALAALGHNLFGPGPRGSLAGQVRLWANYAEGWQFEDPDYLEHAAAQTEGWVSAARAVLEPRPRYRLRGLACPVCNEATALVWSDVENEYVRQAALSIDTDRIEAVCQVCDSRWGLDAWEQLGRALQAQQEEAGGYDCE